MKGCEIMEADINRRNHLRFPGAPDAFAALGESFTRVGKINDISAGGLSFDYIAIRPGNGSPNRVDLFLTRTHLHLSKLPCRLIYNRAVNTPPIGPVIPGFVTYRCGLQFGALQENQTDGLQRFMAHQPSAPVL